MKTRHAQWAILCALMFIFGRAIAAQASPQAPSPGTVLVSIVVSVEPRHGEEVPEVYRQDVRAFLNGKKDSVADWVPLRDKQAGLELFVLIDESIDPSIGMQFDDLRRFMNDQPSTTALGVGYMRNGAVEIVQNFTPDHALAGKALRLPIGPGIGMTSPYLALSDLIKRWPESANRHEVLMVSSGIDVFDMEPNPPYLLAAVDRAQRAGVQVYTLYASGAGHSGHSMFRINSGQNNLAQVTEQTGGEAYFQGFQTPIAFAPFLKQLADRLRHQYRLTILATPGKKANSQSVRLETEVPNAELVAAESVYVPAAK